MSSETASTPSGEGIVTRPSARSVAETVSALEAAIVDRGLTLFATVDHSGEAHRVGLEMPETRLLIFGSPRQGTPLMAATPLLALDLPLKVLVWQDAASRVWVSHNSTDFLAARYGIPEPLRRNIAGIDALVQGVLAQG